MDDKQYRKPLNKKIKLVKMKDEKDEKLLVKEFKPFLKYFKLNWGSCLFIALFFIVETILSLLMSVAVGTMLASFTENFVFEVVLKNALNVLILGAIEVFSSIIFNYLWADVVGTISVQMSHDVLVRVNSLQQSCFDNTGTVVFTRRINDDPRTIITKAFESFGTIVSILGGVGFISYTFTLNVWVGLCILGYVIFDAVFGHVRMMIRRRNALAIRKFKDEHDSLQSENVRGIKDIKGLNNSKTIVDEVDRNFIYSYSLSAKATKVNNTWEFFDDLIGTLINFAFLALAAYLILTKQLFIAGFMIAYNYKGKIVSLSRNIFLLRKSITDCLISAKHINELFDESKFPTEHFGTEVLENVEGKLEFRNVTFGYTQGKTILNKLSFSIEPNSIVSIVGESGVGKSTIISLVNKLYSVEEGNGAILLDGHNINDLTQDSLRDNICIVSQSPYIFDMTVAENLRLANINATDEELVNALKKAELYDFVMSLKDKMNAKLGENGIKLSGGQKQRLAIARALLKNAKVIIFDEATSSLDNDNQAKIKMIIKNLSSDHTILMVAHRLSTVVDSDKIMFVKDGKVSCEGTHEELMENCEEYKKLYSAAE